MVKKSFSHKRIGLVLASELALLLANSALLLAGNIENAIAEDEREIREKDKDTSKITLKEHLAEVHPAFKDDTGRDLANILAQTISIGMFGARLYGGPVQVNFSRQNAVEFIPDSLPFLKKLFRYIASSDLDNRIVEIINESAEILRSIDFVAIMNDFKKTFTEEGSHKKFYQTFLAAYNEEFHKNLTEHHRQPPIAVFIDRAVNDSISSYEAGVQ